VTTPEHYRRLGELFQLACAAPADRRAGLLDRLWAGDAALRAELEAMLASDERPLSLFDRPLAQVIERLTGAPSRISLRAPDSDQAPVVKADSQVQNELPRGRGHYHVLGEIARGGMGVVLRGHDDDLGRDIALKVLHNELVDRPEVLQRFVEEAQIGGQLQHPGIVPVYELGLMADQRPYFTMKLVSGRTLGALLEEREAGDRRRLLDVFESVCQTIAYAHSRGVIHRDLKPANVMVGAFGEVQVVDWGLAKVLASGGTADEFAARRSRSSGPDVETTRSKGSGSGSRSQVGSVMGTPAYMPPEQARGEVERLDERTDVFALGAILCEILTGKPPYTGETGRTIEQARMARLEDAHARLDACRAEPELIALCKRCLTAEQDARPRSAKVLAEAVQAFLSSVEERARAAQIEAAQAQVKAREERKVKRLAIALAAVVLAAGAGSAWTRAVQREQIAGLERSVQAALEEGNLHKGRGNVQGALAAAEKASELAATRAIDRGLTGRVAEFLEEARRAVALDAEVHEREERRAVFRRTIDRLRGLERTESYEHELAPELGPSAAIGRGEGATPPRSASEARERGFAAAFADLGVDLERQDDEQFVIAVRRADVGDDAALALDSWARVRSELEGPRLTQQTQRLLALAKRIDGDPRRSAIRDAIGASDTEALVRIAADATIADESPVTLHNLASALLAAGRVNEALAVAEPAVARHVDDPQLRDVLVSTLMRADPPRLTDALAHAHAFEALRPQGFRAVSQVGAVLDGLGRLPEAERYFRRAIELDEESRAHFWLGWALQRQLRFEQSVPCFQRATELAPDDLAGWIDLGYALTRLRRYDAAAGALEQALALAPDDVEALCAIGHLEHVRGRIDGALAYFRRAVAADASNGQARAGLAALLNETGDAAGAEREARRAIEIGALPATAYAWDTLGNVRTRRGDLSGALEAYGHAVELAPGWAGAYLNFGVALEANGEPERALAAWNRCIELDSMDVQARARLALHLSERGDAQSGLALADRALELDPDLALAHSARGACLMRLDDPRAAVQAYERALALNPRNDAALVNLGAALSECGEYERAAELYRRALAINERDAVGHSNLGAIYLGQADLDAALAELHRAVELDPGYVLTMHNLMGLAERARRGDRLDLAEEAENALRAFAPDPARFDRKHVAVLDHLGRYVDLEQVCRLLLADAVDDPFLLNYLGWALLRQGRHDEAEAVLRHAIPLDAEPSASLSSLAWILATHPEPSKQRCAEAAEIAARAVELDPSSDGIQFECGVAFFRNGDLERAQRCMERSQDGRAGGAPLEWCILAMIHARRGDPERARELLDRARAWRQPDEVSTGMLNFTADELRRFLAEAESLLVGARSQAPYSTIPRRNGSAR
jgi:serine/threonine-protein kinase